ncbi:MAG: DUF4402 domain-containing protein [Halanaerobiales bacterium]|nr:DUF4402 domain-containing protein [Halanaerobiales bacterium]
MKKLFVFSLVMVMVFGVSVVSLAGNPVTATADIDAEVLAVIEVTNSDGEGLDFGVLAPGTVSGNVTVGSDGTLSTTNIPYHDGNVQAAKFIVSGPTSVNYSVAIPSGTVTIEDPVSSETMNVSNFTTDFNGGSIGDFGTFYVGATLEVGANQVAGSYSGTFDVIVTFE